MPKPAGPGLEVTLLCPGVRTNRIGGFKYTKGDKLPPIMRRLRSNLWPVLGILWLTDLGNLVEVAQRNRNGSEKEKGREEGEGC